ncbi:hypothetical protein BDF20DRAFT_866311, partial [Mycotypha africana]|uniref:uncharacterized protein n=1 Tax=Mycotypha africana TaxID=64632 RepID=UPI0022FFEC10
MTTEELFQDKPRSQVASTFYHLLGLASKSRIRVYQREPYGSIDVTVMPLMFT